MGCGETLVKYILFITNLLFALGGLALLGIGIGAQVQISSIAELFDGDFQVAPIFAIVVGSVVFVISFFGCCGAIRENSCMLITYTILMLVLIALKVTLSGLIFANLSKLESDVPSLLEKSFNVTDKSAFHDLESTFTCCGTTGPDSYGNGPLPNSCCLNNNNSPIRQCTIDQAYPGCNDVMVDFFKYFGILIAVFALVVAVIEVIAVVFGCCLSNHIKNRSRRTRY